MALRILSLLILLLPAVLAEQFVLIRGGVMPGRPGVRVDDFEIADAPITNAEYKLFLDAAKHKPPLHWEGGRIPAGMENMPVIFVNRYDAAAYLKWRSAKEGRIYRLPAAAEFEYAARAGAPDAVFPWGKDAPAGKANYDAQGDRTFAEWRKYLKPVKSYAPNGLKLYDMAGNVWQMVATDPDYAEQRYIYRIEDPIQKQGSVAGGSWARTANYMRVTARGGASAGIRHPDLGFRLVREPAGATSFQRQPRRVIAANLGPGAVYVGWQLLRADAPGAGFHVYRSARRDAAGERITTAPVKDSTNFADRAAPAGGRVFYRVRAVDGAGKEGPPSEWAAITIGPERSGLIATFAPTVKQGGFVPMFGDLDGDGVLELVVKINNGITEMSRDPGLPVELEAYTSFGRALWRRPLVWHDHCFGNANNVPTVVYDVDGDGRAEVMARLQEGDKVYLAILDGMTGRVRRKTPWRDIVTDISGTSTRIHMAIAYLDGKRPSIITQTGLYENEVFEAFDANLKKQWTYESFGETNGSGSHHIDVADVDGDGRDEVFDGTTCLNPDGTMRWSIYRLHPDIVAVKHILPNSKDRQVYYAVESGSHAGAFLVDAKTGKIIWKVNREDDPRWVHAHIGWASDIWDGSPGMEMLTNRDGHDAKDIVLFSATGKILANPFPGGWRPVNWTGAATRELMSNDGKRLGRFNGKDVTTLDGAGPNEGRGNCNMVADLAGDYRDEVVCMGQTKDGNPAIFVYSNLEPAARRELSRTEDREYRIWLARNMGGGYPSYFE
ncbi:MAG: SUMF1/EgtB/PvdO family nonheme iron enzyme [Bryobacterales bacterium]|nr:SUMF1/EgtB/PvdO family nonheme iron enzyme [Bryobacterales bacterium]